MLKQLEPRLFGGAGEPPLTHLIIKLILNDVWPQRPAQFPKQYLLPYVNRSQPAGIQRHVPALKIPF